MHGKNISPGVKHKKAHSEFKGQTKSKLIARLTPRSVLEYQQRLQIRKPSRPLLR